MTGSNPEQRLVLWSGLVLDFGKMYWLPWGMSSLTRLTSNDMHIKSHYHEAIDLVGLQGLVNLVSLEICSLNASMGISSGFSA